MNAPCLSRLLRPLAILGLSLLTLAVVPGALHAQRQMEKLGRGLIAMRTSTTTTNTPVYIGWRLLGNDPDDIAFNLYRSANGATPIKLNAAPLSTTTDYVDALPSGTITTTAYTYSVRTVRNGAEVPDVWANPLSGPFTLPANAPTRQYFPVHMTPTPDDTATVSYNVKFCWVGDLDGDGEYDFIVDRSNPNVDARQWLQAYRRDGTLLWQMNMGPNSVNHYNITPGSSSIGIGHGDNVTVYDLDGDGKAEVIVRTANGVIFADGTTLTAPNDEVQYISVLDGMTGVEKARATVPVPTTWVTQTHMNGHMGILYADGMRPSVFWHSSNRNPDQSFNEIATTWDYRNGVLTQRWSWPFSGHTAAAHQVRFADVNNDGLDEYVDIGLVLKADGTGQINEAMLNEVGHGDRFHIADIDPDRPGLETYLIQQNNGTGLATVLQGADKGQVIKKWYAGSVVDVGRGVIASLDPNIRGMEMFSTQGGIYDPKGNLVIYDAANPMACPFPPETIWWDADLAREFVSTIGSTAQSPGIDKFSPSNPGGSTRLFSIYSDPAAPTGNYIAYGGRPAFWGDILGDWREELLCVANDNSELRIYSTKIPAINRLYTLMHNPQYRIQATTKGYVQSSYVDYYLGYGMTPPPPPPMVDAKLVWRGGPGTSTWDAGLTPSWLNNGTPATYTDGDTVRFDLSGNATTTVVLSGALSPGAVTVYCPKDYTFAGNGTLGGAMKLTKVGAGTLTLAGSHPFTGNTTVWDGALLSNGDLLGSPVTVWGGTWGGALAGGRTGGRVGGTGRFSQPVLVRYRGAVTPGAGMGSAGTITFGSGLTMEDRTTFALDLSDDPTGTVKSNDQVAIIGNLSLSGTVALVLNPLNGTLPPGSYTLITYTGTLTGSAANFTVFAPDGLPYTVAAGGGAVTLTVPSTRPAAGVTWSGGLAGNKWDVAASANWKRSGAADVFVAGDTVTFDDTGVANPTVNLTAAAPVAGVIVNTAIAAYTLTGSGAIAGPGGLTKTGAAVLTVTTPNTYTGPTVINGGVLAVDDLNDAGSPGAIGASTTLASNLVLNGGTLRLTGTQTNTDRSATLGSGGGTIDVAAAGSSLQISGVLTGTGNLTKTGPGTLILANGNTYSGGTTINGGTIYLAGSTPNVSGPGTGSTVTISNGVLSMADVQASETAAWNIVVPAGATARLEADGRCTLTGALTGSGNFTLFTTYVRTDLKGNWSGFTGRIGVVSDSSGGDFRVTNTNGYANAAVSLGDNVNAYYNVTSSTATIDFGELSGTAGSTLGGAPTAGKTVTWRIGARNTDSTFAGLIANSAGPAALTKVGTGTLTLAPAATTTLAGLTAAGNATVTVASTAGLLANMPVAGPGIPAGTAIAAVPGNTTLTLSRAATAAGNSTLTFTGINTYTGPTSVQAGTLAVNGVLAGTAVTVSNGATLTGNGTIAGSVTVAAGGRILFGGPGATPLTIAGNVTGTTTLNVVPPAGPLAPGTYTLLNYTGTFGGSTALSFSPPAGSRYHATFDLVSQPGKVLLTVTASPATLTWTGAAGATWDTAALNWSVAGNADKFIPGDSVVFDDTGANPAVSLATTLAPVTLTVNATQAYTLTGSGALSGATALVKSGSGRLILAVPSTATGGTTLSAGILQVGAATPPLGSGPLTLAGGTLAATPPLTTTLANPVAATAATGLDPATGVLVLTGNLTGNATLTRNSGSGQLALGGTNAAFAGNVTSTTGTVRLLAAASGSAAAHWSLTGGTTQAELGAAGGNVALGALSGNATLTETGAGNVTWSVGALGLDSAFDGVINAGSGGGLVHLAKVGPGRLTLTGNHTYGGTTTVAAGILQIGGGGASGTLPPGGPVVVQGQLVFNRSDALACSGNISGSGSVVQQGPGTLTLSGLLTHTGNTTVAGGTLALSGTLAGSAILEVQSGATLALSGNITAGTIFVRAGGTLTGAGTLTATVVNQGLILADGPAAALQLNGPVTNTGTLRLTRGAALLTDGSAFTNSGTLDFLSSPQTLPGVYAGAGTLLATPDVLTPVVTVGTGIATLTINAPAGHAYQLQRSTTLAPASWTNVGTPQNGTGSTLSFTDSSPTAGKGFYRVLVSP